MAVCSNVTVGYYMPCYAPSHSALYLPSFPFHSLPFPPRAAIVPLFRTTYFDVVSSNLERCIRETRVHFNGRDFFYYSCTWDPNGEDSLTFLRRRFSNPWSERNFLCPWLSKKRIGNINIRNSTYTRIFLWYNFDPRQNEKNLRLRLRTL